MANRKLVCLFFILLLGQSSGQVNQSCRNVYKISALTGFFFMLSDKDLVEIMMMLPVVQVEYALYVVFCVGIDLSELEMNRLTQNSQLDCPEKEKFWPEFRKNLKGNSFNLCDETNLEKKCVREMANYLRYIMDMKKCIEKYPA